MACDVSPVAMFFKSRASHDFLFKSYEHFRKIIFCLNYFCDKRDSSQKNHQSFSMWGAPSRFVGSYLRLGINPGSPSDKQLDFFAPWEFGGSCQEVVLLHLSRQVGENSHHYRPWIITFVFLLPQRFSLWGGRIGKMEKVLISLQKVFH